VLASENGRTFSVSGRVTIDRYQAWMSFTPEEIEQWHRDRRAESDKIEAGRMRDAERARSAAAVAVCIHCGSPFGISEGYVSDEVEICYVCLD
jgi:hypothetical protein